MRWTALSAKHAYVSCRATTKTIFWRFLMGNFANRIWEERAALSRCYWTVKTASRRESSCMSCFTLSAIFTRTVVPTVTDTWRFCGRISIRSFDASSIKCHRQCSITTGHDTIIFLWCIMVQRLLHVTVRGRSRQKIRHFRQRLDRDEAWVMAMWKGSMQSTSARKHRGDCDSSRNGTMASTSSEAESAEDWNLKVKVAAAAGFDSFLVHKWAYFMCEKNSGFAALLQHQLLPAAAGHVCAGGNAFWLKKEKILKQSRACKAKKMWSQKETWSEQKCFSSIKLKR